MTVRELIAQLSTFPEDALVVLSEDAEGNGFSPLSDLSAEVYEAETTWSGELSDSDEEPNSVVLWPVN
jgi:hypothetical protein